MLCRYIQLRPVPLLVIINILISFASAREEGFVSYLLDPCLILSCTINTYKGVKNIFNYILCREYHVCDDDEGFVSLFRCFVGSFKLNIPYQFMNDFAVESRNKEY